MTRSPMVAAVDIGYGNVKFIKSNEADSMRCDLFPAEVATAVNDTLDEGLGRHRNTVKVMVNGDVYEVGPDVGLFSEKDRTRILHDNYVKTPQYRALLYGALRYLGVDHIDLLVLGLPVHLFEAKKAFLRQQWSATHTLGEGFSVTVGQVGVLAQPVGGFIYHTRTNRLWHAATEQTNLLVDAGHGTFDFLVTHGLDPEPNRYGSVRCGVADFQARIAERVKHDYKLSFVPMAKLDRALRSGEPLRLRGESIDLKPYAARAAAVWDRALAEMENRLGTGDDIENVCIVGGGGRYLLNKLRERFPKRDVMLVDEPVFANVCGFQLIGRSLANPSRQRVA